MPIKGTKGTNRPNFPSRGLSALTVGLALVFGLLAGACAKPEPVQPVSINERLYMDISQRWVLQRDGKNKRHYRLGEEKGVKLSFEDQTRDYGTPMTAQGVRGAIGSELNQAYGGVTARLTYRGNALLDYSRSLKEGRKKVYSRNWVVARPYGYGAISRFAITLKIPDGQQDTPEIKAVIELLDTQIGDAEMPEV